MHFLVIDVYYALPFGKIYGYVKDTNGKNTSWTVCSE